MAKYDPDRIAETADPYAPGASGIEPLCDEFGRMVLAPGSGGSGGGDASAANQTLILNAIDAVYDALQLVGLDTTSAQIRDAVADLGAGATLADLAAAFATDAITQADILTALEAQGVDVASLKASVDLLVPDLDAVRVAVEAMNAKFSQVATGFVSVRMSNGTAFLAPLVAGENVLADLRVGGSAVSGGNPVPVSGTVTATISGVATETTLSSLNGKFAAAGTHSDGSAQTSTTQVRVVLTGINPAAWGGAGTLSAPACDARGLAVQGYVSNGAAVGAIVRPMPIFWDGTNQRFALTDTSGRQVVAGPGASTPATSVSQTPATTSFSATGAPTAAQNATVKASAGRLHGFRVRGAAAGTYYIQWHNVASTGALGVTQRGLGFEISGTGDDFSYTFPAPVSFDTGITWALSTDVASYVAAAGKTAYVDATWE